VTEYVLRGSLGDLLKMSPEQLAKIDIAAMNLLCAAGLPGNKDTEIDNNLLLLDTVAERVASETKRVLHKFHKNPQEYDNSEAIFRMAVMSSVLRKQFKAHYDPNAIDNKSGYRLNNPNNDFMSGLVSLDRTGTCASMPVLFIAMGRRLEYPLKLVASSEHFFVRWDSPEEKFNIEATSPGFNTPDDNHYREWPHKLSESDRGGWNLKSMNSAEEFATFLALRAETLRQRGALAQAKSFLARAQQLAPASPDVSAFLHNLHLSEENMKVNCFEVSLKNQEAELLQTMQLSQTAFLNAGRKMPKLPVIPQGLKDHWTEHQYQAAIEWYSLKAREIDRQASVIKGEEELKQREYGLRYARGNERTRTDSRSLEHRDKVAKKISEMLKQFTGIEAEKRAREIRALEVEMAGPTFGGPLDPFLPSLDDNNDPLRFVRQHAPPNTVRTTSPAIQAPQHSVTPSR
jgi:hypothetical protein